MNSVATSSYVPAAARLAPAMVPSRVRSTISRPSGTQPKALTELASIAAATALTPVYGIPSAAAIYFTARYVIPAYQNYVAPSSAVPDDMPGYKHKTSADAMPAPRMKHGKKAPVSLKATGTMHIKRR